MSCTFAPRLWIHLFKVPNSYHRVLLHAFQCPTLQKTPDEFDIGLPLCLCSAVPSQSYGVSASFKDSMDPLHFQLRAEPKVGGVQCLFFS